MVTDWPIRRKLLGGVLLTSGVVLVITSGTFLSYEIFDGRRALISNMTILARVTAANSNAALAFGDPKDAGSVLDALKAEKRITAGGVFDENGKRFAAYPSADVALPALGSDGARFSFSHLTVVEPIFYANRRLGTVIVQTDLSGLYRRLVVYLGLVFTAIVVSGGVASWLSFHLQGFLLRPIFALSTTASTVSVTKDYSARAERYGDDELGRFTDVFNEMLTQIGGFSAELEKAVLDRTAELETVNKQLDSYSYTVAHDLRAPLRHIQGYGQMLKRTCDAECTLTEKAERYLATILTASADMGRLVDDLLTFSRMGRAEIKQVEFSLDTLVDEVIASLEITDRNIDWRIVDLPMALGDQVMFKQVLINLIGNAVKYSRKRDPAIIEIGIAGEENGRLIVFVKDNGAGFDQRYADKLFGVFQRLHRADEFEGTGIGLATVRQIVTRHGGRVWGEGEVDKGATFWFTIDRPVTMKEIHGEHELETHSAV